MPVYAYKTISDILRGLERIADKFMEHNQLFLTPDEFIAGFIKPDHVDILKQTQDIVGRVGMSMVHDARVFFDLPEGHVDHYSSPTPVSDYGGRAPLTIHFHKEAPIILPRYVSDGFQPHAPEEVTSKVRAWVRQRYDYGVMFGDARIALDHLNDVCPNAPTMAAFFPALQTVMAATVYGDDKDSPMGKRAERLLNSKVSGTPPAFNIVQRTHLKELAAFVNSAAMLMDVPLPSRDDMPAGTARLSVSSSRFRVLRPSKFDANRAGAVY